MIGGEVEYEIRFGLDVDGLDEKTINEAMFTKDRGYTTVYFADLISTIQVVLGAGNAEILVKWPAASPRASREISWAWYVVYG